MLQNYDMAGEWYRRAAERGVAAAQSQLGALYANGQGVPQSYEEAVQWYQSAQQGDALAQFQLGVLYANGQGVPQSYEDAVQWYQRAAEQGHARAQSQLGVCCMPAGRAC